MTYDAVHLERDPRGVVTLTLNTPEKRNVLSATAIRELTEIAQALGNDADVRAVVLQGAGKMFCAGGDLNWMKAQVEADRAGRMAEARKLADMLRALNEMPKPLIGRLHGGAFGGGVGLACICDVTLAEPSTKFCFSETKLGIIPATIGPYVLARMGEGRARQVFMSARVFDATEAVRLGVVSRVVPAAEMDRAVEDEIAPYLITAPGAAGAAKRLARSLGPKIDDQTISDTIEHLADIWETEEARHGITAFLEKSPARWS